VQLYDEASNPRRRELLANPLQSSLVLYQPPGDIRVITPSSHTAKPSHHVVGVGSEAVQSSRRIIRSITTGALCGI